MELQQELLQIEALMDVVIAKVKKIKEHCHQRRAQVNGGVSTPATAVLDDATIAAVIAKRESRRKYKP
jgi:hypothetical protein